MSESFSLHPQLAADCVPIGDLAVSRVLLKNDARFPWVILVPRRAALREIFDLEAQEGAVFTQEINTVARMLQAATKCDKINIAALGNQVPQLHVHIIARFINDEAWPQPVWCSTAQSRHYAREESERITFNLRENLHNITSL